MIFPPRPSPGRRGVAIGPGVGVDPLGTPAQPNLASMGDLAVERRQLDTNQRWAHIASSCDRLKTTHCGPLEIFRSIDRFKSLTGRLQATR